MSRASIKFAVDKIGAASKKQTDRSGHDQIITEVRPGNFMAPRIVECEPQNAKHAAVTGHAAFPHAQDRQRLAQHFRLVEKNVAEPTPEQHAEDNGPSNE